MRCFRKIVLQTIYFGGVVLAFAPLQPANALVINATFDASLSTSATGVINNAIAFYQTTFSDPIVVGIQFHSMNSGLGSSTTYLTTQPYSLYRTALGLDATSADDATALANTPVGVNNPITGTPLINLKTANARAVGINAPGASFNFAGSPCAAFTGDSCIGLNLAITNDADLGVAGGYSLISVVEHEIDEALGLGSELPSLTFLGGYPQAEDLFRWAGAGVRSFAPNTCGAQPSAFFSIDGGVTNLNQFNNCTNGGDYGDWITHTPTQVQDAFTNKSGNPFLTLTSVETRALDVVGYTLAQQTPMPEPTSLGLLGLGLLGLAASNRKRAN
jgi:hypothetical protein